MQLVWPVWMWISHWSYFSIAHNSNPKQPYWSCCLLSDPSPRKSCTPSQLATMMDSSKSDSVQVSVTCTAHTRCPQWDTTYCRSEVLLSLMTQTEMSDPLQTCSWHSTLHSSRECLNMSDHKLSKMLKVALWLSEYVVMDRNTEFLCS